MTRVAGGNEDNYLWVERGTSESDESYLRSVWVPTEEERQRIAAGANISLVTLGTQTPPLLMLLTDEELGR